MITYSGIPASHGQFHRGRDAGVGGCGRGPRSGSQPPCGPI